MGDPDCLVLIPALTLTRYILLKLPLLQFLHLKDRDYNNTYVIWWL